MNEVFAKVYNRFIADKGFIGYCIGVPGGIYICEDADKCLEMCIEVKKALDEEKKVREIN